MFNPCVICSSSESALAANMHACMITYKTKDEESLDCQNPRSMIVLSALTTISLVDASVLI